MTVETRFFDRDDFLGTTKFFHYDHDTDDFMIETRMDQLAPLVESNTYHRNTDEYKPRAELRHVASIPMPVYDQMKRDGKIDDERYLRHWLNDRDQRPFRVNDENL